MIRIEPPAHAGTLGEIQKVALLVDVGRLADARALVERFVATADDGAGGSIEQDVRKHFTCYRYLAATGDERADAFLVRAHDAMMKPAGRLNAEDRVAYFTNIGLHREIAAAWPCETERPSLRRGRARCYFFA